jgi:CheY-like chemotaxis protein
VTVNKALVVDDSNVVRVILKRMLEARGLGVDTVASGQEALDYLKGQAPDVIFMDYMMAGLDGYEVTAMIRRNPRTSTIPVFMCTADDTPQEQSRAHECGANGFVTKPVRDAALDALLAELRAYVAAPLPFAAPTSIPAAEIALAAPAEDTVRVAERIAHEVAERLVHEAIAALSATSEQTVRSVAQTVAARATQDALASWRVEVAKTNERAEHVAVAAAEQAAQAIMQRTGDETDAARQAAEKVADEKLREALVTVQSTAARVARETLDSAKAAIEDASRQILDSARADLKESSRIAAEDAARPVAEAAARAVIEQMAREPLAAADEVEPALRDRLEQGAIAAAEQAAQTIVHRAAAEAEAARQLAEKVADEKLREALLTVQSAAERFARETLDSAKAAIEDASRQILDSARADLQESSRIAAEDAARVAETAARAVIEQVVRETLTAAREEEAASRSRVEQTTIAVAERVGRELVRLAFSAAVPKRQAAAGERIHAMESLQAHGEEPFDEQVNAAAAEVVESTFQTRENSDAEPAETASITTPARGYRRVAIPTAWTAPGALLPWLAALTLAVLYLLVRSFL